MQLEFLHFHVLVLKLFFRKPRVGQWLPDFLLSLCSFSTLCKYWLSYAAIRLCQNVSSTTAGIRMHSFLYLQCLGECLTHTGHSLKNCQMNHWGDQKQGGGYLCVWNSLWIFKLSLSVQICLELFPEHRTKRQESKVIMSLVICYWRWLLGHPPGIASGIQWLRLLLKNISMLFIISPAPSPVPVHSKCSVSIVEWMC